MHLSKYGTAFLTKQQLINLHSVLIQHTNVNYYFFSAGGNSENSNVGGAQKGTVFE